MPKVDPEEVKHDAAELARALVTMHGHPDFPQLLDEVLDVVVADPGTAWTRLLELITAVAAIAQCEAHAASQLGAMASMN